MNREVHRGPSVGFGVPDRTENPLAFGKARDPSGFAKASPAERVEIAQSLCRRADLLLAGAKDIAEAKGRSPRRQDLLTRPDTPQHDKAQLQATILFRTLGEIDGQILREAIVSAVSEEMADIRSTLVAIQQRQIDLPNALVKIAEKLETRTGARPSEDFQLEQTPEPGRRRTSAGEERTIDQIFSRKHPRWQEARAAAVAAVAGKPLPPAVIAAKIREKVIEFQVERKSVPNRLVVMGFYRVRLKTDRNRKGRGQQLFAIHESLPKDYERA